MRFIWFLLEMRRKLLWKAACRDEHTNAKALRGYCANMLLIASRPAPAPAAAAAGERSPPSWSCCCRRRAAAGRTLCLVLRRTREVGPDALMGIARLRIDSPWTELPEKKEKEVELWVSVCRKWQCSRRGCTYSCAGRPQARRPRR